MKLLGLACVAATATATGLQDLDRQGVQDLLVEWNLHEAFGPGFERQGINGELLSLYVPGDFETADFPEANKLHVRLFNQKIREHRAAAAQPLAHRRALNDGSPVFSGLSVRQNNSAIVLGEYDDTGIKRVGAGKLSVLGDLLVSVDGDDVSVADTLGQLFDKLDSLEQAVKDVSAASSPPCMRSCNHIRENFPAADSGEYCIVVDAATNTTETLYCDMDFLGGGWTYVARGTDSTDGCQQDSYGTVTADIDSNSRWSLGQDVINTVAAHGYDYIEYYVTVGHNNDNSYDPHDDYRIYRAPSTTGMNFAEPMDSTYNVQVWAGEFWITGEFNCNPDDCGPCWEPGRQNLCCESDGATCDLALQDNEGQWSHSNTNQHLRCTDADYDQDQLVLYVRGSNVEGNECYSSCFQAKQHRPDAPSGVYCIIIGGQADNRHDLYCDMETHGGGWTYVARGTNSDDGCDTDTFGTIIADHYKNSRWSLGNWAINEIGYDQGSRWLEYYVTNAHNNDEGIAAHEYARLARVPLGDNFTLGSPMDLTYSVEVWSGSSWVAMAKDCAATDCGPCWEPDNQNWCCEMEQSGLLLDCPEAGQDQEGQWSNANTNQHLRCFDGDYDQDGLVLFVR